jgi:hypothetical protein
MDISKRLLLLKHIDNFVREQYGVGTTTSDILGMLSHKSTHYQEKFEIEQMAGTRGEYVQNYSLYLRKKVIDFQYFRKKSEFSHCGDLELFNLLDLRDKIIFNKIFNKTK